MDVIDKHRTFLFLDDLDSGDRTPSIQCRRAREFEAIGLKLAGDGGLIEFDWLGTDGDVEGGWNATSTEPGIHQIGRFEQFRAGWDGSVGAYHKFESLTYPHFKSRTMVSWDQQNFEAFATFWEGSNSPLLFGPQGLFTPVVDECGMVIGYYGERVSLEDLYAGERGEIFYVRWDEKHLVAFQGAKSIEGQEIWLTAAGEVMAGGQDSVEQSEMFQARLPDGDKADVLVDIDGYVMAIDVYYERSPFDGPSGGDILLAFLPIPIPPSAECLSGELADTYECRVEQTMFQVDLMFLMIDIVSLGRSAMLRRAVTSMLRIGRNTSRAFRALKGGGLALRRGAKSGEAAVEATSLVLDAPKIVAPKAIVTGVAQSLLPDGRVVAKAPGLSVTRGYKKAIMGVPEEHFQKMVEAAKETNGIAVFRANKGAAIPLIQKGAHPKAKHYNAFKTSKETGVLTTSDPMHMKTAYEHGDFVVGDDLVPRRMIDEGGEIVVKELPLNNVYWKLEKGQVIRPDGHPVVGDYDLLGFLPNESAGRSLAPVPDGHTIDSLKSDWLGPDVRRYQEALNARLDQPRVLHGAQDQFQHSKFGGLTDDTAYAVYGDGSVVVMEGRTAQEAFYKAYNRQTALGAHVGSRRVPGTPLPPGVGDLEAMRARKRGGK